MRRAAPLILLPLALVAATGCTYPIQVSAPGAEQAIINVVSADNHFVPDGVLCPSGVRAKVGRVFVCHFYGPQDAAYVAHLTITKVHRDQVTFSIKTTKQ